MPPLPNGSYIHDIWVKGFDSEGRKYFVNKLTHLSQWEEPKGWFEHVSEVFFNIYIYVCMQNHA